MSCIYAGSRLSQVPGLLTMKHTQSARRPSLGAAEVYMQN